MDKDQILKALVVMATPFLIFLVGNNLRYFKSRPRAFRMAMLIPTIVVAYLLFGGR
jgi:hypothetical protein